MASIYDFVTRFKGCLGQMKDSASSSSKAIEMYQGARSFLHDMSSFLTLLELRQDAASVGQLLTSLDEMIQQARTSHGQETQDNLIAASGDKARGFVRIIRLQKVDIQVKRAEVAAKAILKYEEAIRHAYVWLETLKGVEALAVKVGLISPTLERQNLQCVSQMGEMPYGYADRHPSVTHTVEVAYQGALDKSNGDGHLVKLVRVMIHCNGTRTEVSILLPEFLMVGHEINRAVKVLPSKELYNTFFGFWPKVPYFSGNLSDISPDKFESLVTGLAMRLSYLSDSPINENDIPRGMTFQNSRSLEL